MYSYKYSSENISARLHSIQAIILLPHTLVLLKQSQQSQLFQTEFVVPTVSQCHECHSYSTSTICAQLGPQQCQTCITIRALIITIQLQCCEQCRWQCHIYIHNNCAGVSATTTVLPQLVSQLSQLGQRYCCSATSRTIVFAKTSATNNGKLTTQ